MCPAAAPPSSSLERLEKLISEMGPRDNAEAWKIVLEQLHQLRQWMTLSQTRDELEMWNL